jgi:hypothetical protein
LRGADALCDLTPNGRHRAARLSKEIIMQNTVHATRPAAVSPTILTVRPQTPRERLLERVEPYAGAFLRCGIPAAQIARTSSASALAYELAR